MKDSGNKKSKDDIIKELKDKLDECEKDKERLRMQSSQDNNLMLKNQCGAIVSHAFEEFEKLLKECNASNKELAEFEVLKQRYLASNILKNN